MDQYYRPSYSTGTGHLSPSNKNTRSDPTHCDHLGIWCFACVCPELCVSHFVSVGEELVVWRQERVTKMCGWLYLFYQVYPSFESPDFLSLL